MLCSSGDSHQEAEPDDCEYNSINSVDEGVAGFTRGREYGDSLRNLGSDGIYAGDLDTTEARGIWRSTGDWAGRTNMLQGLGGVSCHIPINISSF